MTPTLRQVAHATADYYGLTVEDLCSPYRDRAIAWPRQLAWTISRKVVEGASLPAIAQQYNRDHTTVLYGINSLRDRNRDEDRVAMIHIEETLAKANEAWVFKTRRAAPQFQTKRKEIK